ncbi:hypothetical protein AB0L97_33055 [Nocardia sp. NPDC051911]|uniref:hypothetical protein n=1 Tax=Nocardia sp. NPDC051911 TaxID=3154648 RepID=UPI00342C25D0
MPTTAIRGGAYLAASPFPAGTTPGKVPIDTLDTAAYPYTAALVFSGVVVRGTGPVLVTTQCTIATGSCTAQLRIGGTTVATGNTALVSQIVYLHYAHDGDQLQLWESDPGTFTNLVAGAANTYIHYEPLTVPTPPSMAVQRAALF